MLRATIDLIGMYTYDKTLLDEMVIPQAIDKEVLKDNLLMEAAELEVLYSDPNFLKMAIGAWSRKQLPVWMKLWDTTQYEYNPIWNKDGKVTETRDLHGTEDVKDNLERVDNLTDKLSREGSDTNTRNLNDTNIRNLKDKESRNLKDETLNSVYGFNSSTDAPADKSENTNTGTNTLEHTGTDKIEHTGTDTYEHKSTDTTDHTGRQDVDRTIDRDTSDTGTITRVEQGNIGVTSTQSLILEQREVVKLNMMDVIIHDFINRFCLKIY